MRDDLRTAAAELLAARRARDAAFGDDQDGFGEPAWDMLLHLTAYDGAAREDELLTAGGAPVIASRYLTWLTSRQLVARQSDIVSLAPRGCELMEHYLDAAKDKANA